MKHFLKKALPLLMMTLGLGMIDFLAPYSQTYYDKNAIGQKPTKVYFWQAEEGMGPFIYEDYFSKNLIKIRFFVSGTPYKFLGIIPATTHLFGLEDKEKMLTLWGADTYGRDLFSRILLGSRISILLAIFASYVSVWIGLILGCLSALLGGWIDMLIQCGIEIFKGVPRIIILLLAAGQIPAQLSTLAQLGILALILGGVGWLSMAKLIRTRTFFILQQEFVLSAKMQGAPLWHILHKHLLPQLGVYTRIFWWQSIPSMIITESTMSFLGLGVREPTSSLGLLLGSIDGIAQLSFLPWLILPGVFLILINISFVLWAHYQVKKDPLESY